MKWNTHENICAKVVDNFKNYSSKFPSMWLVLLWPQKCWELIFEPSLYIRSSWGGVSYCFAGLVPVLSRCLEDLLLDYLGDFFSLGVPGYGWNKKPKGKQGCCRWVDILSSCFHVVWQEVNRPPPPHPSSPFFLPSHRLLMMFAKDRLQSWGVPRKKDCFDVCWTSQQPWSLGSCLFLRIPSLWRYLDKGETLCLLFWLWCAWLCVLDQIPTHPIEAGALQVWTLTWATENESIFLLNHLCFIKHLKWNDFNTGALIKNTRKMWFLWWRKILRHKTDDTSNPVSLNTVT